LLTQPTDPHRAVVALCPAAAGHSYDRSAGWTDLMIK
jgi:hypothetical protein